MIMNIFTVICLILFLYLYIKIILNLHKQTKRLDKRIDRLREAQNDFIPGNIRFGPNTHSSHRTRNNNEDSKQEK